MRTTIGWRFLGEAPYRPAWDLQRALARAVEQDETTAGFLVLLTHPPTFTTGRRDSGRFFNADRETLEKMGFAVVATDRGGFVTYHGPGQLVGYPILALSRLGVAGVADYVDRLQRLMIGVCASYGVTAQAREEFPGVWAGEDKIGAIGIRIAHGVATHGFALNVAPRLEDYRFITACGLSGRGVTSLARLGVETTVEEAARRVVSQAETVFDAAFVERDLRAAAAPHVEAP
ncbi:MAG: lipoyl(octanoyl) transferase LipB [Myxococcales bacterium]|nr:MAG: lipoyl(octanoyl) transferase LipB [Myxococcales bacterium]